jgi:hypothetical protein
MRISADPTPRLYMFEDRDRVANFELLGNVRTKANVVIFVRQ